MDAKFNDLMEKMMTGIVVVKEGNSEPKKKWLTD